MKNINFFVTGDTHGRFERLSFLKDCQPDSTAVIILGDFGANYYLDKKEKSKKDLLNSYKNYIYAVRGNHEERPENIKGHSLIFDEIVQGYVWCDTKRWPYIRYFVDGNSYVINDKTVLVIGGAYSVDKDYRLQNNIKWFDQEQLSPAEMAKISKHTVGKHFDIVLSHTCPFSWQPTDLFLPFIDQSKVDNTMEEWLDTIKDDVSYNLWLFGHFHDDRIVRPHVEMFYKDTQSLDETYNRWNSDVQNIPLYWNFDPQFDNEDNKWSLLNDNNRTKNISE